MAACVVSTELYGSTTDVEVWGWWYLFLLCDTVDGKDFSDNTDADENEESTKREKRLENKIYPSLTTMIMW